jgi:isopentenyl diphosphate isomerase/L-lactate dehydrogenase-like FMN-dependent dehydrogenase
VTVERTRRDRRELLRFVLGSPLLGLASPAARGRPELALPETVAAVLDVFQMQRAAQRKLDLPTWHFIVNGADDQKTVDANRAAFDDWEIRVRRLVDVSRVETGLTLFGQKLSSPILLAPVGSQGDIHPDAEMATMRGASARGHLMIVSTVSSSSVGEIRKAGSAPLWFQLYPSVDRELMRFLLARAEAAGCPAVAITVDSPTRGNREGERWFATAAKPERQPRLGNFDGFAGPPRIGDPGFTWEDVDWVRSVTRMRVVLKGIVTAEDAALAAERALDGIIVSNHGGRQEESGRATLRALPEVVSAVAGRMPVLIDGGIRRGTDVFKALALGAQAVCVGRPYLFGLGAFGEEGVARVLAILDAELARIMQLAGTSSLTAINRERIGARA